MLGSPVDPTTNDGCRDRHHRLALDEGGLEEDVAPVVQRVVHRDVVLGDAALGQPSVLALQERFETAGELRLIPLTRLKALELTIQRARQARQNHFHQLLAHEFASFSERCLRRQPLAPSRPTLCPTGERAREGGSAELVNFFPTQ